MTLKIAICDDEAKDVEQIYTYLQNFEIRYDINFEISKFCSAKDILSEYDTTNPFHVIFLDVEMPDMNGIELAKHIRQHNDKRVQIVFVSNYPRYMRDSFEVHPFHYLTKVMTENEFQQVMWQIVQEYEESHVFKLIIQGRNGKAELVNIHDVLYIEAIKNKKGYLSFVLQNQVIQGKGNLKDWEKELVSYHFVLSHRSILVNVRHIHFFKENTIILTNGTVLPLSRRRQKDLKFLFSKRILTLHT